MLALLQKDFTLGSVVVALTAAIVLYTVLQTLCALLLPRKPVVVRYQARPVGQITLLELSKHDGSDPYRPLLFAVRGKIYDVTEARNFYGPGAGYSVFAGREISRALGKMAINADECSDKLDDLTPRELQILADWEHKFKEKYEVVGEVVPPKQVTLEELATYDGSDPSKPIYLAVKGTVFDVTTGKNFYGPDGPYPFGGRECARALAKFSVDPKDCNDDLEGCTLAELDALRDWQATFYSKYPIVGEVAKK